MTRTNSISELEEMDEDAFSLQKPFRYSDLHPGWLKFKDLLIHIKLFEEWGLLAVTLPGKINRNLQEQVTSDSFPLGKLTFELHESTATPQYADTAKLLSKLNTAFTQTEADEKEGTSHRVITNPKSVYLPLPLTAEKNLDTDPTPNDILYTDLWLSNGVPEEVNFTGFSSYVTAECLFGANLKADCGSGNEWPMLKHKHLYYDGQKIRRINYNPDEANAYEASLLMERKRTIRLMNAKKDPSLSSISCLTHIPGYDYMLFGISLFLKNRIVLSELERFFRAIRSKEKIRDRKIAQDFEDSGIKHEIGSPFDALFTDISSSSRLTAEAALEQFGIPAVDVEPEKENKKSRGIEKKFVQQCLDILCSKGEYSQIWADFIEASDRKIQTLEDLFKVGNSIMIAKSAYKKNPYEVCSILPTTEKQIQVEYQKLSTRFAKLHPDLSYRYPPVFNITILDPVLALNNNSRNRLYYFDHCKETLRDLITNESFRQAATQNRICNFFRQGPSAQPSSTTPVALSDALKSFAPFG